MKKVISIVLTIAMALSCAAASSAADMASERDGNGCVVTMSKQIGTDVEAGAFSVSPRIKNTFSFSHSGNGNYNTLYTGADLAAGQTVTVTGTWSPAYTTVWVQVQCGNYAVAQSFASGESVTLTLDRSGSYDLRISSFGAVSGILQVTW